MKLCVTASLGVLFAAALTVSQAQEPSQPPSRTPRELQQLAWMVGDWSDREVDGSIRIHCEWVKNHHFLKSSIWAKTSDGSELELVQLIGWDPDEGQIRSWVFDSYGGFGTALWRRTGKKWISEPKFTRDDGTRGTAMNIYNFVDDKTFKWQCVSRTNTGAILSGIDEVTLLRRATANGSAKTE